jgi:hypothetical protein
MPQLPTSKTSTRGTWSRWKTPDRILRIRNSTRTWCTGITWPWSKTWTGSIRRCSRRQRPSNLGYRLFLLGNNICKTCMIFKDEHDIAILDIGLPWVYLLRGVKQAGVAVELFG